MTYCEMNKPSGCGTCPNRFVCKKTENDFVPRKSDFREVKKALKKFTYGFNYNLYFDTEETTLTTISIPAENEEMAQNQLRLIFGGKLHLESISKQMGGIYLVNEEEY